MAQVRSIYTPAEWGWVEHSATASVASQTAFKLAGNQTTNWTAGRRWRLKSGSTTRYGAVVSSSFTAETTITVTVDSGSLSASHSLAALAAIDSNNIPTSARFDSIELGAASDTTITRSAAGVLAVEGGVIPKENRANTFSAAQAITSGGLSVSGGGITESSTNGILVTGSGPLGFSTGSGGTVTQITSKSTGVTLNKTNGQITMNNAALAAGATVTFSVTNTTVGLTDTVILSASANAVSGQNYRIELVHVTSGGFTVRVTNISAGSLSEAIQINFAVIKAVTS